MKALFGPVTNIRPVKSQGVTRIEIEVPIEGHVDVTEFCFNQQVLVTLAPPALNGQPFGLVEPQPASAGEDDEFDPQNFRPENIDPNAIVTFSVSEGEAKDLSGRGWAALGALCQSAIMLAKTETFQQWVLSQGNVDAAPSLEEQAANYIRRRCGVQSRKELDESAEARINFRDMMQGYRTWLSSAT